MSDWDYISAADTAKLARPILKREFPDVKFSVTTETYSGGASMTIQWVDGPTEKQVQKHIAVFGGKGFDGMIDLEYSYRAWLLPDGTATIAKCAGSAGSGGRDPAYENPKPHPDARLVHFGTGYIHYNRHNSPAFVRRVAAELEQKTGWTAPAIIETDSYWSRTKHVRTAYFENWRKQEDRQNWEEFSHCLYLTPGDAPLVTRFDYAFEEPDEPEPEPEPERTEAQQIETYHETLQEIAEGADLEQAYRQGYDDEFNDHEYRNPYPTGTQAHEEYHRGSQDGHERRKTIPHEERTPAQQVACEDLWTETVRQIEEQEPEPKQDEQTARVARDLKAEIGLIAREILATEPGAFVVRCVARKVDALGPDPDLHALFQVGADLALIAAKLGS